METTEALVNSLSFNN